MRISGNIVDVVNSRVYPGTLVITRGRISRIIEENENFGSWLLPGFVDSHVHVESSMMTPSEFGRIASIHGTVAAIADPHEIANVLGVNGVKFMIRNGRSVPFRFYFGAPSCVPATPYESSGSSIGIREFASLLKRKDVKFMAEMMNFPGVVYDDPDVMEKISAAKKLGKTIDGHAPGLRGENLRKYIGAGISTDHEMLSLEEGREKMSLGMKILVREGSAAKDFNMLSPLINEYPDQCMLCSDDVHPDDLVFGHINRIIELGIEKGLDLIKLLRCASLNPARHYGLEVGLLQPGDQADLVEVDGVSRLNVLKTFIGGRLVAENGRPLLSPVQSESPNRFNAQKKSPEDFRVRAAAGPMNVITAVDGRIITGWEREMPKIEAGYAVPDTGRDLLKIAVIGRYEDKEPAVAFIRNFGLKRGAIASSVAHDSHNIVAVGVSDHDICAAANLVIEAKGGLSVAGDGLRQVLPLEVAGIMTGDDGFRVAEKYKRVDQLAKRLGSTLAAPFMTLSFMALLVIPRLKLSDKGLFDSERFQFTRLFSN